MVRYLAKSYNRSSDKFWLDEAIAEATYIITETVILLHLSITEKFPDEDERLKFYRMTIGHGVKAYFAHRSRAALSRLRKMGITINRLELEDSMIAVADDANAMSEIIADSVRSPMERRVLSLYIEGVKIEDISAQVELKPRKVRKLIRSIKRRLRNYSQ